MPKIQLVNDTGTGIGSILDNDCLSCEVIEALNGEYEVELAYPIDGEYYSDLIDGYRKLILCKPNPYADPDYFRIYEIKPSMSGGSLLIRGQHISYDLAGIVTAPFTATSAVNALIAMKEGAYTDCPFEFESDVQTNATMTIVRPTNIRILMGGMEGSIIQRFGGEYEFEGNTVRLLARRGTDRGSEIRYGKNLLNLEQEKNCANVYTAVIPYYYSDEVGLIQGNMVQVEGNYDFVRVMDLDLSQTYTEVPTVEQIEEYARQYIMRNKVGVPRVSMTVDFVLLETTQEYKDSIELADKVLLGDSVSIYFERFGINSVARVIQTRYNVLTGNYISVALGDDTPMITDTLTAQNQVISSVQESVQAIPSYVGEAVNRATANITGVTRGHIHYEYDSNGAPTEFYIMDTDSTATAQKVWRWNLNGLGYSSTGINGNYDLAITADGEIVANFITAGELDANRIQVLNLTADMIRGGTLQLGYADNVGGVLEVFGEDNERIALLDNDGLKVFGADGSYVLINTEEGFAGYDKNNNKIYWAAESEFHMNMAVVENEIMFSNKMRFIPIEDTGIDGIGIVTADDQ